jgi:hypothetical protein
MFGKYVAVSESGQPKLYLPLKSYTEIERLIQGGYQIEPGAGELLNMVRSIKSAEERRKDSDQRKQEFVEASLRDFSREVGHVELLCPYCLGRINQNLGRDPGAALCGYQDAVVKECSGNALYTIDRVSFLLGRPAEVEKYRCQVKNKELDLAIYEFSFLKEEIARRRELIQRQAGGESSLMLDAQLAKIFPLRISISRTRQSFKELVYQLMQKEAIDWLNTLTLEELESLMPEAAVG